MKRKQNRHLGLRVDEETLYKLHSVAEYEGRSVNQHILYLVRQDIREFENANGEIAFPPEGGKA